MSGRLVIQTKNWLPIIIEIAKATGSDLHLTQFAEGSNIVFAAGTSRVIKLFPLELNFQFKAEEKALKLVESKVNVQTPKLITSGRHHGLSYLVMEKVDGLPLSQKWPLFEHHLKKKLLFQIGQIAAAHHRIEIDKDSIPCPDWSHFIREQIDQCTARQTKMNLPKALIDDIPNYLKTNAASVTRKLTAPVLLTGEYTPGNIMIDSKAGEWSVTGIIDYGDAMIGHFEYDFLGPATFLAGGSNELLTSFLKGYGVAEDEMNTALSLRLMTLLLLHRYSNFEVQIQVPGWKKALSLSALAQLIFPF